MKTQSGTYAELRELFLRMMEAADSEIQDMTIDTAKLRKAIELRNRPCTYTKQNDGRWLAGCSSNSHGFGKYTPMQCGYNYCQHCGRRVEIVTPES